MTENEWLWSDHCRKNSFVLCCVQNVVQVMCVSCFWQYSNVCKFYNHKVRNDCCHFALFCKVSLHSVGSSLHSVMLTSSVVTKIHIQQQAPPPLSFDKMHSVLSSFYIVGTGCHEMRARLGIFSVWPHKKTSKRVARAANYSKTYSVPTRWFINFRKMTFFWLLRLVFQKSSPFWWYSNTWSCRSRYLTKRVAKPKIAILHDQTNTIFECFKGI